MEKIRCLARNGKIIDKCRPNAEHPDCQKCHQMGMFLKIKETSTYLPKENDKDLKEEKIKETKSFRMAKKSSRKTRRSHASGEDYQYKIPAPQLKTSPSLLSLGEEYRKARLKLIGLNRAYKGAWERMDAHPRSIKCKQRLNKVVKARNDKMPALTARHDELWSEIVKEKFRVAMGEDYDVAMSKAKRLGYHLMKECGEYGCNEALLKLISWDRRHIFEDWAKARILSEDEKGNKAFLKALGRIIAKPSNCKDGRNNEELLDFLLRNWDKRKTRKGMFKMARKEKALPRKMTMENFNTQCRRWGFVFATDPKDKRRNR